jgi:transposase InsO family protein
LDHLIVFSEANLRRVLSPYVTYYNRWRPHRSLGQAAPCGEATPLRQQACRKIAAAANGPAFFQRVSLAEALELLETAPHFQPR